MTDAKRWEDLDFAPEVEAALRRGPRPATRLFLFIIAAVFAGFIFWADRAVLDEVTRGEGRVIPSSQLQVVQSLEGGIVKEILIRDGDIVERDQILLRIDDTGASSSLGELRAQQYNLQVQISRLLAEAEGREDVAFSDDLTGLRPGLVRNELELFQARQQELASEVGILRQQAQQREQELEELKTQESALEGSLELVRQELGISEPLARSGVVSQVEVLRLRREVNDLRSELETTRAALPRAESAIREAHDRVHDADLRFQSQARQALNEQRAELAVIDESIRAATDRVVRTDVRSPVAGIVNAVNVTTVGGVVQPGQRLVEIVPLEDTLLVEAEIRPSDVAFLRPGLPATVKVTAYDFSVYGGLEGEIERISADTIQDEETGESFYRVIVRTGQNHLGSAENPLPIIPGMVTTVDVLTGEKTVLEYLLKPLIKAQNEALRER